MKADMIELARDVLAQIQAKGRPCGVVINRDGIPTAWPMTDVKGREGINVARAIKTDRFVGTYGPECPVEWLAADLAAESWQLGVRT